MISESGCSHAEFAAVLVTGKQTKVLTVCLVLTGRTDVPWLRPGQVRFWGSVAVLSWEHPVGLVPT